MQIAVTGATGFLGRYIVKLLTGKSHTCRCWTARDSDRGGFTNQQSINWIEGGLQFPLSIEPLIEGAHAVVHAGLYRPPWGEGHRGADTNVVDFAEVNLMGTLRLMQAAKRAAIDRFVFISTCGVHDVILDDRPLDETHPLWPLSHYGAHKAAIEKFVHSFGLPCRPAPGDVPTHRHLAAREAWGICALRPVGIYGIRRPLDRSKWYPIVRDVMAGRPIDDPSGGKEVHARDVARAVELLLHTDLHTMAGQSYNCCDHYVSAVDVAQIARQLTASPSRIIGTGKGPKHQIDSSKIRNLGLQFGGRTRLEQYVAELIEAIRARGD